MTVARTSAVLLAALLVLATPGCSPFGIDDPTLAEGRVLGTVDHGPVLPASRQGYAGMGTFLTAGGGIQVFDPGTGPDDPPQLVRTIQFEAHNVNDAQIGSDGYLWVATPDASAGGSLQVFYVLDPHTAEVHRAVEVPLELRAVAGLTVTPGGVFFRAWRDGFSGGIGVVSRSCVSAARECDVDLFAELGDVGVGTEILLRYREGSLYSFNTSSSRSETEFVKRYDPTTGRELARFAKGGTSGWGQLGPTLEHVSAGVQSLFRLNATTLAAEAERTVEGFLSSVGVEGGTVYAVDYQTPVVQTFAEGDLTPLRDIDVGAAGRPLPCFGFMAPGVLMLRYDAWLNTRTGDVVTDAFPLSAQSCESLRLPEGHPLAF